MKYKTVSALCEGVAGAIREKEGSTALINPQDFADRIKGLEVGGGIPDVPTLECWKITPREMDDKHELFFFLNAGGEGISNLSLAVTEMDGVIYGGTAIVFGSGSGWAQDQIFYIAFVNKGDDYYMGYVNALRENLLGVCGEQMPISEFLSVVGRVQNFG